MDWKRFAACIDRLDIEWFPEGKGAASTIEGRENLWQAKQLCKGCPVREECLAEAMADSHTPGIWGGTTMYERRKLARPPEASTPINHGTNGGYQAHLKAGDPPCDACRAAMAAYKRSLRYRKRTA